MLNFLYGRKNDQALTLIEAVLAMAAGAAILVPLTMVLKIGLLTWKDSTERGELNQHARVAMSRIITELRYAESLVDSRPATDILEFDTSNLVNNDPIIERIKYWKSAQELRRSVDDPVTGFAIAGMNVPSAYEKISLTLFESIPYKISGIALVPLVGADPVTDAVAVKIKIEVSDDDGDIFMLESMAKLRNR